MPGQGGAAVPDKKLSEPQLRSLLDVGMELVSELDLEKVLRRILVAAKDLAGARYAALGRIEMSGTAIDFDRFLTLGMDDTLRSEIAKMSRVSECSVSSSAILNHSVSPGVGHPVFDGSTVVYPRMNRSWGFRSELMGRRSAPSTSPES